MAGSSETRESHFGILAAVLFGTFIYTSGNGFLGGGLGPAGRSVGLGEIEVGTILSVGALLAVGLAPAWGWASERWSRRRLMLVAIGMVSLAPAAMAVAFGAASALPVALVFAILLAARLVQSAFGAALLPLTQAYVAQFTEPHRRLRGMGVMSIVLTLGTVAGSALLFVVAHAGVTAGFSMIAALGVVALVVAAFRLPEIAPPEAPPPERVVPVAAIWPNVAITFVGYVAYTMVQPLVGLRLADRYLLSLPDAIGQTGLTLALSALGITVSQGIVATVGAAWSTTMLLRLGSLAALAGSVLLAVTGDVVGFTAAMVAVGFALGFVIPANLGMISLATGRGAQGKVGGINTAARGLGIALGPITGTVLYNMSADLPFAIAAVFVGVVVLLTLVAGERRPPKQRAPAV
jgi:predicted MFS family arabinose efflux permease